MGQGDGGTGDLVQAAAVVRRLSRRDRRVLLALARSYAPAPDAPDAADAGASPAPRPGEVPVSALGFPVVVLFGVIKHAPVLFAAVAGLIALAGAGSALREGRYASAAAISVFSLPMLLVGLMLRRRSRRAAAASGRRPRGLAQGLGPLLLMIMFASFAVVIPGWGRLVWLAFSAPLLLLGLRTFGGWRLGRRMSRGREPEVPAALPASAAPGAHPGTALVPGAALPPPAPPLACEILDVTAGGASPPDALGLRLLVLWSFDGDARDLTEMWRRVGPVGYLRGGEDIGRTADRLGAVFGSGAAAIEEDDAEVRARIASFAHAPDDQGRHPVNSLLCNDRTWTTAFRLLMADSDVVVLDLRTLRPDNDGCRYELQHLVDEVPVSRWVVVAASATEEHARALVASCWAAMTVGSPNRVAGAKVRAVRMRRPYQAHSDREGRVDPNERRFADAQQALLSAEHAGLRELLWRGAVEAGRTPRPDGGSWTAWPVAGAPVGEPIYRSWHGRSYSLEVHRASFVGPPVLRVELVGSDPVTVTVNDLVEVLQQA